MKQTEQIDAFSTELDNMISRYTAEFDLDMHTIIGVLESKKVDLLLYTVDFEADADLGDDHDDE